MNTKEAIERLRTRFDKWALDNEDLTALQVLGIVDAESEKIRKAIRLILIATEDEQKDFYSTHGLTRKDCTDWLERQKEREPIKMEVYEVGKGTTICGRDYKCKKDYKIGTCRYIKDAIYHCSRDGYLTDQNGISWSCTPEWFNEYFQSNTEWAEEEKTRFVSGQFLQCKLSFDGFKEGEHYWLEYIGDDMYVGRSDNILNQKFHITPRQLYTLFSQQLEEVQGPPQEEKQVSLNYEQPFDENPSDDQIIDALIHHLNEQDGFLTAINCVSTKAILNWLKKQKGQKPISFNEPYNPDDYEVVIKGNATGLKKKEQKPSEQVEINKSLGDAVIAELVKYNGENYLESPWAMDSTGLQYPLHFAELGAKWQKEQKPSDLPAGFYVTLPDGEKYYAKEMRCNGMNIKVVGPKPVEWDKATINGEPIPAENHSVDIPLVGWSEEDEKMRQSIIKDIEFDRNYTEATTGKVIEKYNEQIAWLKCLFQNHKKFNEAVAKLCSNEWSEEDERKLQECIKIVERWEEDYDIAYAPYSNTLKSLRPQPKAELTLLDKNIIEAAVAFVEQNNHFSYWGGIDKHTVIKALRSLKPYWKPSEEQMCYLLAVINEPNNAGSESCHIVLKELYEQLKKL